MPHRSVDLQHWEVAYNAAKNPLNPDRTRLLDVYDSLLVDSHLAAAVETRVLRVLRSRYRLVGADGQPRPDLLPLLQHRWFEDFLWYAMEADFRGHTLIELGELEAPGRLKWVERINPRNVLPRQGLVVRRPLDTTGYKFREAPLHTYLIEVGRPDDLGSLSQVGPMAVLKKYALGSWSDYVHKFGIPARWVKTNSTDLRRIKQLETIMQGMVSSSYGVFAADEEVQIMPTPGTDAHQVFDSFIARLNSEISKRLLGQDGTTDNKDASGTYGSLKVLQGVAEDRHQADKASMAYVINNDLFPRLVQLGYPLAGIRFEWDGLQDLSAGELVDAVAKLGMVFDIDPQHVEERTGIKILGARRMPGEIADGKGDDPEEDDPAVPTGAQSVQDTAMNGAQVSSLLELITKVAMGEIPESVARPVIKTAFPKVSDERINEMLAGMKDLKRNPPEEEPGNPPGNGKQAGKKKGKPDKGSEDEDDEDGDGLTATAEWPGEAIPSCSICGGGGGIEASGIAGLDDAAEEELLRAAFQGEDWSPQMFEQVASIYRNGLRGVWDPTVRELSYNSPEHVAHAHADANLYRFAAAHTMATATDLGILAKQGGTYADFKRRVDESGKLQQYTVRDLRTNYANVVNTGLQAARYHQMMRSADVLPFGEYLTMQDGDVRDAHRLLHGKVWPLDHEIWKTIWPPNGWRCRCTVLPTAEGPDKATTKKQTQEALQELTDRGEMKRMEEQGFDGNRAMTGEIFRLNSAYKTVLGEKAGEAQAFNVEKAYGRKDMELADVMKRPLPQPVRTPREGRDILDEFDQLNPGGVATFTDFRGIVWGMERRTVAEHTAEKYRPLERWDTYGLISEVLAKPDEVWVTGRGRDPVTAYSFVKFYDGLPMVVRAEATRQIKDQEAATRITSWYPIRGKDDKDLLDKARGVRTGLPITKMPLGD